MEDQKSTSSKRPAADAVGNGVPGEEQKQKKQKTAGLGIKTPVTAQQKWKVADTFDAFKLRISKEAKRYACIVFPEKILKLSKQKVEMEKKSTCPTSQRPSHTPSLIRKR